MENVTMKVLSVTLLVITTFLILSCQKEVVKETITKVDSIIVRRDSIIIRRDSIIIRQDIPRLFQRRWNLLSHEIEFFTNGQFTGKKAENFIASGFYHDFKSNGTYTSYDLGGNNTGTYELLADNYYVLDKNTSNERYYYILSISDKNFINRGPFDKDNRLLVNYLFTAYFKSN